MKRTRPAWLRAEAAQQLHPGSRLLVRGDQPEQPLVLTGGNARYVRGQRGGSSVTSGSAGLALGGSNAGWPGGRGDRGFVPGSLLVELTGFIRYRGSSDCRILIVSHNPS